MPGESGATEPPRSFFVVLGFVQAVWPLTMDLYLPSFPQIEHEFATTPGMVQLTLTGAFIGMAVGQVLTGPLSDRVGRVRPLLGALALHVVATVACVTAPTIGILIASRVAQGLGAAACAVTTLAIVRDSASGPRMVLILARLQLVNGAFVLAAPALGALMVGTIGWRGVFAALLAAAILLATAVLLVVSRRETHPPSARHQGSWRQLGQDYRALAADPTYVSAMVANALLWGGMMSYVASSAFLFQQLYGLSPSAYALVFGGHGGLMILSAQVTARWAQKSGLEAMLRAGALVVAASSAALVVSVAVSPARALLAFMVPLFAFTAGFGMLSPTLQSQALLHHGERAGTAASLLGASTMVAGAAAAPAVASLGMSSSLPVAAFLAVCAVTAGAITWFSAARRPVSFGLLGEE